MAELVFEVITDLTVIPQKIDFNAEEIKNALTEATKLYKGLVLTEEDVPDAKKRIANWRKVREFMESERKRLKKECLAPYEAFEAEYKDVLGVLDTAINEIDVQVKDFDETEKANKKHEIETYFLSLTEKLTLTVDINKLFDTKWLNKSATLKTVCTELKSKIDAILTDYNAIQAMADDPNIHFIMEEAFAKDYSVSDAVQAKVRYEQEMARKDELNKVTQQPATVIETENKQVEIAEVAPTKEELKDITGTFYATTPAFRDGMNALLKMHGIKFERG